MEAALVCDSMSVLRVSTWSQRNSKQTWKGCLLSLNLDYVRIYVLLFQERCISCHTTGSMPLVCKEAVHVQQGTHPTQALHTTTWTRAARHSSHTGITHTTTWTCTARHSSHTGITHTTTWTCAARHSSHTGITHTITWADKTGRLDVVRTGLAFFIQCIYLLYV